MRLALLALTALCLLGISDATAFERRCSAGCTHSGTFTGPRGGTTTDSGTVTRIAPGSVASTGTVTGPRGNTDTRAGGTTCTGSTCVHSGVVTGQNGRTYTTNDSVTRTAPGQFTSTGSTVGANGGGLGHTGSESCADGSCDGTRTVTVIKPTAAP